MGTTCCDTLCVLMIHVNDAVQLTVVAGLWNSWNARLSFAELRTCDGSASHRCIRYQVTWSSVAQLSEERECCPTVFTYLLRSSQPVDHPRVPGTGPFDRLGTIKGDSIDGQRRLWTIT